MSIIINKEVVITIDKSDVQTLKDICEVVRVVFEVDGQRDRFSYLVQLEARGGGIDRFLERIFNI